MKPTHIITEIHSMDVYSVSKDQIIGKPCSIIKKYDRPGINLEPEWKSLYLRMFDADREFWGPRGIDRFGTVELNFYKVKVERMPELQQDQFVGDFESFTMYENGEPIEKSDS